MQFRKLKEQKILCSYLKQNVGWLCVDVQGFQKKCNVGCWLYRFFFEMEFVLDKNFFMPRLERHAIIDRIIQKYR